MGKGVKITVFLVALLMVLSAGCTRLLPEGEQADMGNPGEGGNPGELVDPGQAADPGGVAGPGENGGIVSPKEPGDPDEAVSSPGSGETESVVKQDSGTYNGQIDPHSIEIHISGVPIEGDPRAFQLSAGVQMSSPVTV